MFQHLSEIAANERTIKVLTFADEGIFNNTPTDVPALKNFIFARNDMNYPIYVDSNRVAYNGACLSFRNGDNFILKMHQPCSNRAKTCLYHLVSARAC